VLPFPARKSSCASVKPGLFLQNAIRRADNYATVLAFENSALLPLCCQIHAPVAAPLRFVAMQLDSVAQQLRPAGLARQRGAE
jgi:hypothetical protein